MEYEEQLKQIEQALQICNEETERQELLNLKKDIQELIALTNGESQIATKSDDTLDKEYELFMQEMMKEGATECSSQQQSNKVSFDKEYEDLAGEKCSAPYKHEWGDVVYYNAIISSVINAGSSYDDFSVKVLYINPTLEKMLPCPYFLETENCKFSDEKCKYSHGEEVKYSSLKEYVEPDFESLSVGSRVLAKQSNKIWQHAVITRLYSPKCTVKLDSNIKELELDLQDVYPLNEKDDEYESDCSEASYSNNENIINMSLMNTPTNQALGGWESHTKGIGSKLMQKMGYVVGTGLGKLADGRLEPVTAVVLPQGKSLDYCMKLREKAGGDSNLFSAERKMKRQQKIAEKQSQKQYERENKKTDVFKFLNEKLLRKNPECIEATKKQHRQDIKKESSKTLNVSALKVDEEIKKYELEISRIHESLERHNVQTSTIHKNLKQKLQIKQNELKSLRDKAININHEQKLRHDKRKLTVF